MGKVHASLFSGLGAADLAATWMGCDNAFWCEIEDFPRTVLSYWFPKSKGYGNIKETDFTPWRGKIDILTGGFPCQPFSVAGQRKGADDDRYLWPEMLRAIREIRPTWVIGENVAGITSMVQPGCEIEVESQTFVFEENNKETLLEQEYVIETICKDLEREGYSVQPIIIPACAVGAPHRRDRVWFIANANCQRQSNGNANNTWKVQDFKKRIQNDWEVNRQSEIRASSDSNGIGLRTEGDRVRESGFTNKKSERNYWENFPTQSPICRGNDGLPFDVDCLTVSLTSWCNGSIKGYGNAIVPQVMYEIFKAIELISK